MSSRTLLTLPFLVALAAGAVQAQPAPAPPAPGSNAAGPARPGRPERTEQRIAGLQRRLAITPAQQPQWDAFADSLRAGAAHQEAMRRDRPARAGASAPEGLRSNADAARTYADDLQRLVPAFDALYATLSPEQRSTADRTYREFMGRGGRGPMGRPG